jgi:hypothetical protein
MLKLFYDLFEPDNHPTFARFANAYFPIEGVSTNELQAGHASAFGFSEFIKHEVRARLHVEERVDSIASKLKLLLCGL